jgi:hypothetical protein
MITNLDRDGITDVFADERHLSGAVGEGIVHQVAQGVLEPLAIRHDRGVIRLNSDRPALELCPASGAVGHLVEQLTQRDRLAAQAELLLIRRGEQQQLLGQSAESVGFFADRRHRSLKIIAFRRSGLGQLNLGFDDRHRRTQLVTGVGQELSLLLQCIALRCLGLPDAVEHVVQGASEAPDLVLDRRDWQR